MKKNQAKLKEKPRVRNDEDVVHYGEERAYVSILVLSRSRLLSRSSQACNFFPNTRQSIYIFRNK